MREAGLTFFLPLAISYGAGAEACDERKATPPSVDHASPMASIARAARVIGLDAAAIESAVDPTAPAGDLRADIDAFTTLDACVAGHAHVDPLVGDALEAIGYDTLLRDMCRVVEAAKGRDPKPCEPIVSSALRTRCQATVAQVSGEADTCPWEVASKPAWGRDSACVAIALRDVRLCAAASDALSRATCEAIIRHDARGPCAALATLADKARCARDAERWHAVTPPPAGDLPELSPASGALRVEGADAGAPVVSDLSRELARGLVVVQQRDGARIVLGPLTEAGPGFVASSPHASAALALELFVPPTGKNPRIQRAELQLPGRPPMATPTARSTLTATIDKLEATRGGELRLSVDGELVDSAASQRVHLHATTFIRDIVKSAAIVGASLGAGGGMR
jgi:hypothetical protein